MERDLKESTELMQKYSESLTIITVGSRKIKMQEMAIGRAKKFVLLITQTVEGLSKKLNLPKSRNGKIKWDKISLKDTIDEGGEVIFEEVTAVLNFLFEYKNDDHETLTTEWVEDNISIRILKEIVLEVARQNEMAWLPPFFQSKFQEVLKM